MIRRLTVIIWLLSVFTLMGTSAAYAAGPEESFRNDYPAVTLDRIEKTAIDGVYEAFAGGNIFYYHPKTGNILFGEMISRDFKNITVDRRNSLITASLKSLPLDKAIRIGLGKNVVIEFSDIDCPYCRKMEDYFDKREDVSRYVYLMPLEKMHPESMNKSLSVLCSADRVQAYRDAMKGALDGANDPPCENTEAVKLLDEYRKLSMKLGVQGTPALWINNAPVNGANVQQTDQLLSVSSSRQGKEVKP